MKVDLSCPIELWEYALPTADHPYCSFTFFNLGTRTIASIQITVTFFDGEDRVLSRRVERPMALEAQGRAPFVVEISTDGMDVDTVDLTIDKVWYEDGEDWRRQQGVRLAEYEPNELPPNRDLEQLRYVAGEDAVGFPSDQGSVWICICGRVNAAEERQCRRCDRDKEQVFAFYSYDAVQAVIDSRERELEEKARSAREEASKREFMRQDRIRRKKRMRRTRTAIITAAAIVVVLSYLFVVLGLPELRYQTALSSLHAGDYAAAKQGFAQLGGYRDAAMKVQEADLRLATDYAMSGDPAKVDQATEILAALGDYPGAEDMVKEATYQRAALDLKAGDFQAASQAFAGLGDYRDASEQHLQADYQEAMQSLQAEQYETSAGQFAALGAYLDAAVMAKESVYRPAAAHMAATEYAEAASLFAEIPGYKDADEQRLESLYQDALRAQHAGELDYAAEKFRELGDYEDSPDQVTQSIYLAANSARDQGKYEMAISLYETIPGYEDADEQIPIAQYMQAKAYMEAGEFEKAGALLSLIPDYEDSADLYLESIYQPAVLAVEEERYQDAIDLFEQIPEYSDVEKRLPLARYQLAAQLEEGGKYAEAAERFEALEGYDDAEDRAKAARFLLAEETLEKGEYDLAAEQFEALGRYSDASERAKESIYRKALAMLEEGSLEGAYEALVAIDDYEPAEETARETAYTMGVKLEAEGQLVEASEAFEKAGAYEDAKERRQRTLYKEAERLLEAEDYAGAGALFSGLGSYEDARDRRDEVYDLWLADRQVAAEAHYEAEEYEEVVALLKDIDMDDVPKAYAGLQTMYYDSNLRIARQLINEDRALEAYSFLIAASGYRNASDLLDKNIYRILGTWEAEDGTVFAFYLNGTALIGDRELYFNMFSPYGISIGETEDPDAMERAYNYSGGTAKTLQLREESSGEVLKLTRTRQPEVSRTNDSEAMLVLSDQEREHLESSIISTLTVDSGENGAQPEETPAPEDEAPSEADE